MTVIDPLESPDHPNPIDDPDREPAVEYSDLNLQRRFRAIIAFGVAGLLLMGWLFINSSGTSDQIDSLIARNESLTATNESQQLLIDKLATQLDEARAQGAAVPAPEVVAAETPGAEVSPPAGAQGERGDAGIPGVGTTGATGDPGLPGSVGEQGTVGPRGLPGSDGADGSPGAAGADGASIQGPPGPAGVDGAPGANGAPGQPGADGSPGSQGPGPTDEQIAAAVAAYCSVPGNCTVLP